MSIFLHIAYNRELKYADNKFLSIVKIVMDTKYWMIVENVEEAWNVIFQIFLVSTLLRNK